MTKATTYGTAPILHRKPHTDSQECVIEEGGNTQVILFRNARNEPFEVSRITVKLTALAAEAVCDPQPTVLDRLLKVGLMDATFAHPVAASADLSDGTKKCGLPLTQCADSTFEWVWPEPLAMGRGHEVHVQITPRDSFVIAVDGEQRRVDEIRVEITFEGDSLTIGAIPVRATGYGVEAPLG